jgi:transposase
MREIERRVAREAKAMTRKEVIVRAIEGKLSWIQAAEILGMSARHMRRLKQSYERDGYGGIFDGRGGKPRRRRIALKTIEEVCRLKREVYPDFSVRHFYERATEKHKLKLSYTWTRLVLQTAGLVEKAPARGKYRRRRERRPMTGMLVHLDASTHRWIESLPMADLVVALDDADGRILYARFEAEEGTASTMRALEHLVRRHGRFCALYTDRGSHFCHTPVAGAAPSTEHNGQVSRALRALGIQQILARSPEARGRSERAFGTVQGRLPQELRLAGVTSYEEANRYLEQTFVPDFNARFTVKPAQSGTAFVALRGVDLELLFSAQHDRVVRNDSTIVFSNLILQLPETKDRAHYVRCLVVVHEFTDATLGITFQGHLIARYNRTGDLIQGPAPRRVSRTQTRHRAPHPTAALGPVGPRRPLPSNRDGLTTANTLRLSPRPHVAPPSGHL